MKFAPRTPEEPEVNLISLVDVVFMLLIFFMVTTTFVHTSGLKVSLPQANPPDSKQLDSKTIEVVVSAEGRYYINGRQLRDQSAQIVERGLHEVMGDDSSRALLIRADGRAPHQAVVTVMDVAARNGFHKLSIATTPAP